MPEVQVLDSGFIKLVDHMGTDLSVVNAARISFNKVKETFDSRDADLIQFLAEKNHCSPFRTCQLTFHIKAPIFVLRQWMRHRIASEFNEISGRYVTFEEADWYLPKEFRAQAANIKQGSQGLIKRKNQTLARDFYIAANRGAFDTYKVLLELGVCKEQARAVLPLALYSEVYWTVSLEALANFLAQRLDFHAQEEIRQYAEVIYNLALPLWPHSLPAILLAKQRAFGASND